MLFFLLIFSCVKSINFKSKLFPLEILQNFEEDENYNYLKELGLLDTLNSMSKILLSEPVTFSKYERDILQSILNRDISSFTGIYEGKGFSNEEGLTLLHYAALVGAEDIFEYLVIQKKEDIKQKDYYGRTCLHFAFLSKNFNLCRKVFSLLEQEDKEELLNAKDRSGASCFHYLAFSNLFERYKREKEIEQNTLINFITFSEEGGLKLSIGSNFKDNQGLTPLHYAAYFGDLELCKEFLDGIDEENIQSEEIEGLGRITPLGIAYISKDLEVVKYFECNLKICEEDLKLKEFFELDRDKKKTIFIKPEVRHIDVKAIDNESTIVDQEDEEITENSISGVISGYFSEKENALGLQLQKGKESILHELIRKDQEKEALSLLDKLRELEQEERDEFLKHKDEEENEVLYLAIDRENIKIVEKILELYSEKERNRRLCFEYYEETILDRAIKNRSAKVMMSLAELKKKYRPEDLEKIKDYKVRTELVITDILEEIKRILEEQEKEESFDSEEILLNEEEQKDSMVLKLIEENIEKRKDKEIVIKKENKFKKLIKEKKEEILILASYVGDKGVILRYLEEREVNTKDKEGTPLLFLASDIGHKEVVELLLSKGASIDLTTNEGATPLHVASQNSHKEVVELLIDKGASIDLARNDGRTSLYIASQNGHKEVVELLLVKGASIHLANIHGWTPLLIAIWKDHKEVVELLIDKGASIDLAKNGGITPLYVASAKGLKEVVELLITKGAEIDLATFDGTTPLFIATYNGHIDVVEILLAKGASVDLADQDGWTPLFTASEKGHKEVVELLLSEGASIDLACKDGATPLFIASQEGHKEIVELLLRKGAFIDLAKNDGVTPLYKASSNGHKEVVELLITKGASIDLAKKDGITPLYIASRQKKKEIVELLLTKGASIDLAMNDGTTPLMISSQEGHKEVVELLLQNGADVNKVNKDGQTALMIASQQNKKEITRLLLQNKVNIPRSVGEYRRSKLIEQAINYASEINDSSFCFNGGILLIRNSLDIYEKLANLVPFSYLKDNFFDIPSLNTYGYNSLHIAIFQANTVNLKKLLCDDNIKEFINSYDNKEKETCLALAIRLNKLEHAKDLLSFFASPIYFKNSLLGSKQINVLDIEEVKDYVSSIMIFEVLKDGRSEDAGKLLFGHTRAGSSLELKINNFSYKDKINLKALDYDGRNFFHWLAMYAFDDNDLDHLFSRSATMTSFSKELMYSFDKSGMTPFHYGILKSNEHFVKYYLANEEFKIEDVMKGTKEGKSLSDLIRKESISKEIINLFIKYIWSIKDSDLYNFISSKQNSINDKCSLIKAKLDEMNVFNDGDNNVIYSIMKSDDKELLLFILDKINLNDKKIEGRPIIKEELLVKALRLAIQLNALNCLNELLSRVPKEKLSEIINLETLFKSCVENKSEIITALAKVSEEKLGEKDSEGNTILHIACLNKKEEVVRELLEYGSVIGNINSKNEQGNTAMHNAHMALSPSLISTLKEKGADISIENNRGKKAINLLKDRNTTSQEEIIQIGTIYASLCAMLDREYDADYELTIHLAVLAKEEWVIKDLSTRGLINSVDEEENTPLHIAIKEDNKDMVKALLERGANFFLKNKVNETALELINSKEVLMIVINEALNKNIISEYLLNIQNKEGSTLLHLAVERSIIKVFEEEVETKSGEIKQIKREEIDKRDKQLIEMLLDNGANKDNFNKKSKTPLDIASQKSKMLEDIFLNHEPLLSIMRFREGRYFLNKEEEDKRKGRDQEEEKEVVEVLNNKRRHDIDLSSRRRAIHLVVERNDEYALEVLLDKGSDPEWEDLEGKNCYEIAVSRGSIDAFKMLMKQGDIFKGSKHHASPIYISVEKGGKYFEAVSERIREEFKKGYKIEKLRELIKDPISKMIEADDRVIMEKFLNLGIKIVDEENRNLLIEAIIKDKKQVFNYLIGKASEEEIKGVDREKKTAIEEAQIKSVKDRDSYYARSIQERLKNLKIGVR